MSALHDWLAAAAQRATPGKWTVNVRSMGRSQGRGEVLHVSVESDHGAIGTTVHAQTAYERAPAGEPILDQVKANALLIALAPLLPEVAAALEALLPLARGWSGVVRRQHGHHSQNSAAVDGAIHAARSILSALSAVASADGAGEQGK